MWAHGFHKAAGRSLSAGYTLLELAIATTVSGAVLSGVLTFGAALWSEQRANEFADRMAAVVSTVEGLYPGTTSYDSLDLASAIRLGVMRNENVIANTGVAPIPALSSTTGRSPDCRMKLPRGALTSSASPTRTCSLR